MSARNSLPRRVFLRGGALPPALDGYDVVLLGSGRWNVRPPMIMRTFAVDAWLRRAGRR